MATVHILNTTIYNGLATITPTEGNPNGQTYTYDGGRATTSTALDYTTIESSFGIPKVEVVTP